MASTPNLEKFNSKAFAKEIRAFMKKHELTVRDWIRMSESSFSNLKRLDEGGDIFVSTAARYQKIMRTYKGQRRIASSKKS
jgi:predicted transcriptional regulator